jgi:hypothetical protein
MQSHAQPFLLPGAFASMNRFAMIGERTSRQCGQRGCAVALKRPPHGQSSINRSISSPEIRRWDFNLTAAGTRDNVLSDTVQPHLSQYE